MEPTYFVPETMVVQKVLGALYCDGGQPRQSPFGCATTLVDEGVDPKLDFSDINGLMETAEYCNQLPIHPRHPYAGELVHTALPASRPHSGLPSKPKMPHFSV